MPQAKTQLERNTFVAGLVTEASPLTFPENASIDEKNFVLNRDGSRQRRLGMDLENSGVYLDTTAAPISFDNFNIATYKWESVNNDPTKSFGVIQVGNKLWFVDLYTDVLSSNVLHGGVPLAVDSALIGVNISGNTRMDFTTINGKLIVTSSEMPNPIALEYNEGSDLVEKALDIEIKVRDIWGVDDGLDVDEIPATLTKEHQYNLHNQGWPETAKTTNTGPNNRYILHDYYYNTEGEHPTNAQIWQFGKATTPTSNLQQVFVSGTLKNNEFGTGPAPKGHFVIDAFNRGASRLSESTLVSSGLPADSDSGKITTVANYASRVFYSGVESDITDGDDKSPNYSGSLFYSQIVESDDDLGKCHQENDPTSEHFTDLLATDGGTIKILGAGNILKLVPNGNSLVVVADNGIWELSGPDGVFQADDFSIREITNIGCSSKGSVLQVEGNIIYWGDGGIYLLSPNQVTGRLGVQNITESTIQTLYNDIPSVGRANAVGNFDPSQRKVSWLYNDTDEYDGVTLRKKYNKELIFDVVLKAFYINEIGEEDVDSPFIAGYVPTENFNIVDDIQSVTVNGDQVQVNGEDVIITNQVRSRGQSQTKYLVFKPNEYTTNYGMSFGLYKDADFEDWGSVDAPAYLVTGHELMQDTQRKKQINYLTLHFIRTETGFVDVGGGQLDAANPSGCLVRVQWDFANSSASGKWSSQTQGYRLKRPYFPEDVDDTFDYGWQVITTKNRMRGSGKAMSLRFDSEAGKDLYLLGWGVDAGGVTVV